MITVGSFGYGWIERRVQRQINIERRLNVLEMAVCDLDEETFWYKGDCLDKADFSHPLLPE